MNLKGMLKYMKNKHYVSTKEDVKLDNHEPGNQSIYRLYYINYSKTSEENTKIRTEVIDWPFSLFTLPSNMNREDAFKVLSYLFDYIENKLELTPGSYKSVKILNEVLNIKRLGFEKLDYNVDSLSNDVINLYILSGNLSKFKKSRHHSKYFEWYKENVKLSEVKRIYKKSKIKYYDLESVDNSKILSKMKIS